jgi:hypothetical protein
VNAPFCRMMPIKTVLFAVLTLAAGQANAQLPVSRLNSVFPPGGKAGGSVEVIVAGADLEDLTGLRFTHDGIQARLKTNNTFVVEIKSDVPPGAYEAHVACRYGISNPRAFTVGDRPESAESGTHNTLATATAVATGSVVNGVAEANGSDFYKFDATKGQRILIECAAKGIDSRLDPVLVLYDAAGREIARERRGGLLDHTATAAGSHTIEVHDTLFRGGAEYFYRLAIGAGPHLDFILPPCALPGTRNKHTLYGRDLPGGVLAPEMTVDGKPLEKLEVTIESPADPSARTRLVSSGFIKPATAGLDGFDYRLKGDRGVSNPLFIGIAGGPVVLEREPNNRPQAAQAIEVPCEFAGQFFPRGDRDLFQFNAKKGDAYWIEVISQRLGLPTDPAVVVQRVSRNARGEDQVSDVQELGDSTVNIGAPEFNTASFDPAARFEAKEDGLHRVAIRDLFNESRDNASLVYRIAIRKETQDFRLAVMPQPQPPAVKDAKVASVWPAFLRRGESFPIRIMAWRRDGFGGDIELSVEGLPNGVVAEKSVLPGNASSTVVLLTAMTNAPDGLGQVRVVGRSKAGAAELVREARAASVIWNVADYNVESISARMTRDLPLRVSGEETIPVRITPATDAVLETSVAGKLRIPLQVERSPEFNATLKLKAAGFSSLDSLKELDVDAKTNRVVLEIDLAQQKVSAGTHRFYLQTQTKGKYSSKAEAVRAAEAEAKQAEKAATEAAAEAKKAAEAATAAAKADTAAKEAADKASAEAAARSKDLGRKKDAAAKRAKEISDAAKPRDATVTFYSVPITIKVAPAPITLAAGDTPVDLRPGARIEIPVTIHRLYEFNDVVEITLIVPKDVKGFTAQKVVIAKDQNEGKMVVEAAADATAGDHKFIIQASLKLNNQSLQVEAARTVKVAGIKAASK